MQRIAVLFVFLILWMAFGCAQRQDNASQGSSPSSDQNDKGSQPAKEEEPTTEPDTVKEPQQEPAVVTLSGNGQTATEPFDLESGLAIFRMTYRGESNFISLSSSTGAGHHPLGFFSQTRWVRSKGRRRSKLRPANTSST